MKRPAWLLLIAFLSLNTVGLSSRAAGPSPFSLSDSRPPLVPVPAPAAASIPGYNIVCNNIRATRVCASVSQQRIIPGSFVTVYGLMRARGEPVKGQIMRVIWHSRTSATCIGITDENGLASCTTYVPARMARGYSVNVWVYLDKYKINTHFRTKDITEPLDSED